MNTMTRFLVTSRQSRVKLAAVAMAGMFGALLSVSDAQAFTCVRGVYRAGCVSAYGAVGVSPNGAVAVGRYGNVYAYHRGSSCVWRNGPRNNRVAENQRRGETETRMTANFVYALRRLVLCAAPFMLVVGLAPCLAARPHRLVFIA
jgi:hypothetical protein